MAVADPLSRRPDHEDVELGYTAIHSQQCRWVLHPELFTQMNEQFGPFDADAFKDEHTSQIEGEFTDFHRSTLAGRHTYVNAPFDNKSMDKMMNYYNSQKELDPFHNSAVFIAPVWTKKRWFQCYFESFQLVHKFHKGQDMFLLPSDRLGRPAGDLLDVGPLEWDVGVFYDAPRFAESPHHSVTQVKDCQRTC
mmetsp:Transcript_28134/g.69270  ORF Transcript_28134/g.69270 Transcript_28134/m.69270 type:complete len:193 (-) Transcript_28134:1224-1802(-)